MFPKISVVIPMYNAEGFIGEVIESIIHQTGVEFEVIVVDDGSSDNSVEVARRALDESIVNSRFVLQSNHGEASAVNKGISVSSGQFVTVVNADDPLLRGHLAAMSQALDEDSQAVVAYCDWIMIDEGSQVITHRKSADFSPERLFEDFVCLPGPGTVIRKSAISRKYFRDPTFRYVSDFEAWLSLAMQGPFKRVPQYLATWRMHPSGATAGGRGSAIADETIKLALKYREIVADSYGKSASRHMLSRAHYLAALQGLHSRSVRSRTHLVRSLVLKPCPTLARRRIHRSIAGIMAVLFLPISRCVYSRWSERRYRATEGF